ncbi:MAG: hypothetical protein HFACDABA_02641 [Anaerolineales bacterium]|nr:hypothetical protein [Anaerolineales bacterium]
MTRSKSAFSLFLFAALFISMLGGMVAAAPVQAANHASAANAPLNAPPYSGTAFLDPDIVTASDPSIFINSVYAGRGYRYVYDRRVDTTIRVYAFLFKLTYSDGSTIEAQVNPEFGSVSAASVEAQTYGWLIGQLPAVLRKNIKMLWIHKGDEDFGGAVNAILIHTDRGVNYADYIEEILIHESAHTSLDADHAADPTWLLAQSLDGGFISDYASNYPDREDVAESFLTFLAVRYKLDRISGADATTIQQTIPWRLEYFDNQHFDMTPVAPVMSFTSRGAEDGWILESTSASGVGGSVNSNAAMLKIGDDIADKQYRSILSFDTSALPDNAVITRVTLKIRATFHVGNLISLFQGMMVDINEGAFGNPALELTDFDTPPSFGTATDIYPPLVKGWYVIDLSDGGSGFNISGLTQLRLRFQLENYGAGANVLSFYSGNASASQRPKLIVQYYVP